MFLRYVLQALALGWRVGRGGALDGARDQKRDGMRTGRGIEAGGRWPRRFWVMVRDPSSDSRARVGEMTRRRRAAANKVGQGPGGWFRVGEWLQRAGGRRKRIGSVGSGPAHAPCLKEGACRKAGHAPTRVRLGLGWRRTQTGDRRARAAGGTRAPNVCSVGRLACGCGSAARA